MRLDINSSTRNTKTYNIIMLYILKSLDDKQAAEKICLLFKSIDISLIIVLITVTYYHRVFKLIKLADERVDINTNVDDAYEVGIPDACNTAEHDIEKEKTLYDVYIEFNAKSKALKAHDDEYLLFLAVLIIVNKYFEDSPYSYACWSKLTSVECYKINSYENYVLSILDYNLFTSEEEIYESCANFRMIVGKCDFVRVKTKFSNIFECVLSCLGHKYIKTKF